MPLPKPSPPWVSGPSGGLCCIRDSAASTAWTALHSHPVRTSISPRETLRSEDSQYCRTSFMKLIRSSLFRLRIGRFRGVALPVEADAAQTPRQNQPLRYRLTLQLFSLGPSCFLALSFLLMCPPQAHELLTENAAQLPFLLSLFSSCWQWW